MVVVGAIDVDVLVDGAGTSVDVDDEWLVVDVVGGIDDVDIESSESAEVQALKISNAATVTPTRNGGRVGPPELIDHNRRLTGHPHIPCSRSNPTRPDRRALQDSLSCLIFSLI